MLNLSHQVLYFSSKALIFYVFSFYYKTKGQFSEYLQHYLFYDWKTPGSSTDNQFSWFKSTAQPDFDTRPSYYQFPPHYLIFSYHAFYAS